MGAGAMGRKRHCSPWLFPLPDAVAPPPRPYAPAPSTWLPRRCLGLSRRDRSTWSQGPSPTRSRCCRSSTGPGGCPAEWTPWTAGPSASPTRPRSSACGAAEGGCRRGKGASGGRGESSARASLRRKDGILFQRPTSEPPTSPTWVHPSYTHAQGVPEHGRVCGQLPRPAPLVNQAQAPVVHAHVAGVLALHHARQVGPQLRACAGGEQGEDERRSVTARWRQTSAHKGPARHRPLPCPGCRPRAAASAQSTGRSRVFSERNCLHSFLKRSS